MEELVDNPIWSYFFKPPKEKQVLIDLLAKLPVFEYLSQGELIQVERVLHERRYMKDEPVFKEGDPGAGMYIIKSGSISITRNISKTESIELAILGEGTFFGEIALLDESPRSASASASSESVLLAFPKPDLEKLIERMPRLGVKILSNLSRLISQRLLKTNENMEELKNRLNLLEPQGKNNQ